MVREGAGKLNIIKDWTRVSRKEGSVIFMEIEK